MEFCEYEVSGSLTINSHKNSIKPGFCTWGQNIIVQMRNAHNSKMQKNHLVTFPSALASTNDEKKVCVLVNSSKTNILKALVCTIICKVALFSSIGLMIDRKY